MLLYYIRGQRGVDLDGKCKKKHDTRVTVSPPPNTHTQAYYYSVRPLQEIKELRYQSEMYSQICQI